MGHQNLVGICLKNVGINNIVQISIKLVVSDIFIIKGQQHFRPLKDHSCRTI